MTDLPGSVSLLESPLHALKLLLARVREPSNPGLALRMLVDHDLDQLPLPGQGDTLGRWQALACVASVDLSLAKLFEGHTDALAILAELSVPAPFRTVPSMAASAIPDVAHDHRLWGVWCAEPPDHRVTILSMPDGSATLSGVKAWCSGAASLSHAVVSGWNADGESCLAAVALDQAGVTITNQGWHAVGMRASGSVDVIFDKAVGVAVGPPGAYLRRPGFLHGGAGVAACWYGGLSHVADALRAALSPAFSAGSSDAHRLAHLGAVDVAMVQARAALRDAAGHIDAHPQDDCALACARARLAVESAASQVMERASRALGAGPLCRDAAFAQLMADLPVFIRQSHAERDQAAHGAAVLRQDTSWAL